MSRTTWPAAAVFVVALAACRTATLEPALLSESAVVLDLPLVRQDELYNCGLAAISALCQYWDVRVPPEQREALERLAKDEKGLSGGELREALEADGMEVFLFSGSLDRSETGLYHHVDAGRPLIVMISPDGAVRGGGHHYCLVLGYDEPRHNIILLDPARGEVLRSVSVFERGWEPCQRFTLLATPREVQPGEGAEGKLPSRGEAQSRDPAPKEK